MKKISAVYKITNTITGDCYIGSSKNVKQRWKNHKCPSFWKRYPNNPLYQDIQKYGTDKFEFQILEEVEIGNLKDKEQQFIETLKPTYNNNRAKDLDIGRHKKYMKEYEKSNKCKKYRKEYQKEYYNQLCCYNGETLTLRALSLRFYKAGIESPTKEAKKYLIKKIRL